ncbi:RICIN domain-containing protein [Kribbella sp. NPDC056861]|uniref:RICIN domain-containing protein n=1 Tax=Kribbella sp. NPDC056861 TaxID=3154857 RepID=UPI00343CB8E1
MMVGIGMILAALTSFLVSGAAPAAAAPGTGAGSVMNPNAPYIVPKNKATNKCLDDSFEFNLRTFECNGQRYQRWTVIVRTIGIVTLINQATGRCLDDSGTYGLRSFECNEGEYQLMAVNDSGGNGYSIKGVQTRLCADDSKQFGLRHLSCNELPFQLWGN